MSDQSVGVKSQVFDPHNATEIFWLSPSGINFLCERKERERKRERVEERVEKEVKVSEGKIKKNKGEER